MPDEHRPIISFLMIYGCRPSEARALTCKDVDLRNDCFTISSSFSGNVYREKKRKGRHSQPTVKPIVDEIRDYIADRVKNNLPPAWLFPNPHTGRAYGQNKLARIWQKIREKAKLPDTLKLYGSTRHSRGSQLANNGVSQKLIQEVLGHANLSSTDKYTHVNLEAQRIVLENFTLKRPSVTVVCLAGVSEKK